MRYGITATVETTGKDGYKGSRQLPYFEVNGRVHGIMSEAGAVSVAREVLRAAVGEGEFGPVFHITAVGIGEA